jgi:hypothetical protein
MLSCLCGSEPVLFAFGDTDLLSCLLGSEYQLPETILRSCSLSCVCGSKNDKKNDKDTHFNQPENIFLTARYHVSV